ncbi:MAG: DUF4163 domain-containing protein [Sporomusaceae bacterium]|jgi:hypothetical protein|nr:DUF4163 domain-containing protein [Sporomusaceae bacterium]
MKISHKISSCLFIILSLLIIIGIISNEITKRDPKGTIATANRYETIPFKPEEPPPTANRYKTLSPKPQRTSATTNCYEIIPAQDLVYTSVINYPQIKGMGNKKKQEEINSLIKEGLAYLYEAAKDSLHTRMDPGDNRKVRCRNDYEIMWSSEHLLSVNYYTRIEHGNGINVLYNPLNIAIATGQKIQLKDIFMLNVEFVQKWRNKKTVYNSEIIGIDINATAYPEFWVEKAKGLTQGINEMSDEELLETFNDYSDFYLTKDKLGIWIYIMKNSYPYTQIDYSDLKEFIKDKNDPIWQGLSVQ